MKSLLPDIWCHPTDKSENMDKKFSCSKKQKKKAKDKVGFSAYLGSFNWKSSFSNFSSHLYGRLFRGDFNWYSIVCTFMRLQSTSVCAYWSNVHFKTTRLRVYTCCLPAVVTRALCVNARCDDCTEPHSFIWTGGEEPGADYNLIYWAKLWGSDRGPLALGLPPHTPRFLPTSVFWRSLFIQQKIEAPLPWPPSASDNVLIRSPATGRVVGGQDGGQGQSRLN